MKWIPKLALYCLGSVLLLATGSLSQTVVLEPDWNTVASAKAFRSAKALGISDNFATKGADENLSQLGNYHLPVLGFTKGVLDRSRAANILERELLPNSGGTALTSIWPACTEIKPVSEIAGDENGEWYSLVYDFGCINISVEGERRTRSVTTSGEAELVDSSRGEQLFVLDEDDAGQNPSRAEYTFTRFGIPYSVIIECMPEAGGFCGNFEAQNAVLAAIDIVGGAP